MILKITKGWIEMSNVAIITGASRGIGRAIAEKLSQKGVFVIINYSSKDKDAEETLEAIKNKGGNGLLFKGDVSKYKVAKDLVDFTIKNCGSFNMLINNAGISYHGLIMDMKEDDYDRLVEVNIKSAFNMARHSMEHLLKKQGSILNISSIWSEKGASNEVVYAMTKAAINAFTKSLAREMAPSGIRVNCIAPGLIDTSMNNNLSQEEKNDIVCYLASGRIGTTEDVASLAAFLLSDESQYINGQIITVDGGFLV